MRVWLMGLGVVAGMSACSLVNAPDDPTAPSGGSGGTGAAGGSDGGDASGGQGGTGGTGGAGGMEQPVCGNGTVEAGETCDDGFTTDCGDCNADCTAAGSGSTCGDGTLCEDTEVCDDGNANRCDACNDSCSGAGTPATALLLADGNPAPNQALADAITATGIATTVTLDGAANFAAQPSAQTFSTVLVVVGDAYPTDMPVAGQQDILDAQAAGKGLVMTEWAAYKPTSGQWALLSASLLLSRTGADCLGSFTYTNTVPHPVWGNLPATINWTTNPNGCFNIGPAINGATVIADTGGCTQCPTPGVAVKDDGVSRTVQISHTAAYLGALDWVTNSEQVQLMVNAALWTAGCL